MSVARIDPEIGSYAIIQFKKLPAMCEVAHTSLWDWRPIRGAAPGCCGLERSTRGCRAENKSMEQQRAESRARPTLARGSPSARANQATTSTSGEGESFPVLALSLYSQPRHM